jgi:hypothetical protein
MKVLVICLFMLVMFFGAHVLVWRYKPDFQSKKNLLIIMGVVFLSIGLFKVTLLQFIHISLAYFSACLSYVIFYLWLEGDSPSLHFIDLLSQNGGAPISLQTLKQHFSENNPITGRLEILVEEGLCVYEPPNYSLSPGGLWIARLCTSISQTFDIALEG